MANSPILPVTIVAATANTEITSFIGFSVYEDAAAVAHWTFRHGDASGTILASIKLASGESATVMFPAPMVTPDGVWAVEVAGSITAVVYQQT